MSKTVEEAFEEWAKSYDWIGDDLVAAFAAGAAHGAAEERGVTLTDLSAAFDEDCQCNECICLRAIRQRIRQRGEQ